MSDNVSHKEEETNDRYDNIIKTVEISTQTMDFEETMMSLFWGTQGIGDDKAFKRPRTETRDEGTDDLSEACPKCLQQIKDLIKENKTLRTKIERVEIEKARLEAKMKGLVKELEVRQQELQNAYDIIANHRNSA